MEYLDIKKLVMVWLLIAPIIIIAEVTAQDRNQTQATCNQTQVLRQGKDGEEICCHSTKCKPGETFHLCTENDGYDICSPCGDGYFTALSVDTALVHIHFDPCIKLKCEDGAANINGSCICDILNGYYGNDSSRCIPKNCTAGFVLTLNGHCKLCERQDNCGNITSERQSSGVSFYWITVGIVLSVVGIVLAAALIKIRFYRSRILKTYDGKYFNSSLDDISHTDVTAFHSGSGNDNTGKMQKDINKDFLAGSGNDNTGKMQKDINKDFLDPETSESLGGNQKEIKCEVPYIRRVLKEKEKKQQALPLNPRPVVVDCNGYQIQQESSFSSYSDFNTYDEIEEPHSADSTLSDEFQIEHVVGENVLVQEQNVSSGQNCEINNVVEVPYATAAENDYDYCFEGACSNETHSVAAACYTASDTIFHQSREQEYILSETHDVTDHSHDEIIPKVVFQSGDVDNGEQPYFCRLNLHSSPHSRANNPTVNENLCEVEKRSTEEDPHRFYENYWIENNQSNNKLDVNHHNTETANDEDRRVRRKEFVKKSERERKASSSLSQEGKDQCVRQTESVKSKKKTSPIRTEEQELSICTGLIQRDNDNDLLLKNQERHNLTSSKVDKDQCVRPKEFKPREETNVLQRIVQVDKDQCVRPKEFKPREETNVLQRIGEVDKFSSPTLESHRDIASRMSTFVQNARILSEKNKDMEERIVVLQGENDQKDLTIKKIQEERDTKTSEVLILQKQLVQLQMALKEKTEKLDSIEQHLPELTDLLGQDTQTYISQQTDNQMRVYYDKQPTAAE